MTRSTIAPIAVFSVLWAAGCSTEYEMSPGGDRAAPEAAAQRPPEAAAQPLPEKVEDLAAGLPGADHPGLSAGREAEGAGLAEERADASREGEPALPGQPGPSSTRVAAESASPGSARPVPPEPAPTEPMRTPPPTASSTSSGPLSIRLSAGVALPQSLPIGTTMGFSVDYQFTSGEPGTSPYLWVIQPSKGQTIRQEVQLQARGTLQGFFPPMRPENGPFSTHIEDAQGNRLSKSLPLR